MIQAFHVYKQYDRESSALSDVTLLRIDREDFAEIMAEKHEIAQGVIKVLTRRLRDAIK